MEEKKETVRDTEFIRMRQCKKKKETYSHFNSRVKNPRSPRDKCNSPARIRLFNTDYEIVYVTTFNMSNWIQSNESNETYSAIKYKKTASIARYLLPFLI